jgi:hypothetical protein
MSFNNTFPTRETATYTATNQNSEGYSNTISVSGVATRISGYIGGSVPYWKSLIRDQSDATSDFIGCRISFSSVPGHVLISYRYNGGHGPNQSGSERLTGDLALYRHSGTDLSIDTSFDSGTFNRLKIAFLSKVYEEINTFQSGTFMGELRETLHLLRNPAQAFRKGLGSYLDTLRKGAGIRPASRRKRFASDTWLEYRFGWLPLIRDIQSAAKATQQLLDGRPPLSRVSASLSSESSSGGFDGTYSYNPTAEFAFWFDVYYSKIRRESQRITGAVRPVPPGSSIVSRTLGLDPTRDFLPTAWQLIPYSFLADYFTNIGDILQACSVCPADVAYAMHQIRSTTTYNIYGYYRYDRVSSVFSVPPYLSVSASGDFGRSSWTKDVYVRRKNVGLFDFSVIPSFRIPGLDTKWLNLAALADQHRRLLPFF